MDRARRAAAVRREASARRRLAADRRDAAQYARRREQLAGKDYDPYFEWSDERIYCSELVWKIFERGAGIELGARQTIADFDLSHPAVQQKLKERYGDRVPLDEVVVSPAAIFAAADLETVYQR